MQLRELPKISRKGTFCFPVPALLVLVIITVLSTLLYFRSTRLTEERIKANMREWAAVAALLFAGEEMEQLQKPSDMHSALFQSVVQRLRTIRSTHPEFRYLYIVRKTDEPGMTSFIADADALAPKEELDMNGNGTIEPEEAQSLLGDLYDASTFPRMLEGFDHPTSDDDITRDQWGSVLSGYAPIRTADGRSVAMLGIDMDAEHYLQETRRIFSPVILFLVIVIGMLCAVLIEHFLVVRQQETERKLEQEKSNFLSAASHQLREPITAISWLIDCFSGGTVGRITKKQSALLGEVRANANSMKDTVATMLHMASLESGKGAPHATTVELKTLLKAVRDAHEVERAKKNVRVRIVCDTAATIISDVDILREILSQLLANAIQYTPTGGSVTLQAKRVQNGVHISVSDTGCGIPASERAEVFSKFFRGERAMAMRANGTGIGLYLVHSLMTLLGGSINFTSEEGKGTTFVVDLPDIRKSVRRSREK